MSDTRKDVLVAATPALVTGIFGLVTELLRMRPPDPPPCEHGKPEGRWRATCRPLGDPR